MLFLYSSFPEDYKKTKQKKGLLLLSTNHVGHILVPYHGPDVPFTRTHHHPSLPYHFSFIINSHKPPSPPPTSSIVFLSLLSSSSIHMREGTSPTANDGEPGSFAAPHGRISSLTWVPPRYCPPLDNHLQLEWHLLLLLPLGQVQITPSIFFRRPGSRARHRSFTLQI